MDRQGCLVVGKILGAGMIVPELFALIIRRQSYGELFACKSAVGDIVRSVHPGSGYG